MCQSLGRYLRLSLRLTTLLVVGLSLAPKAEAEVKEQPEGEHTGTCLDV